MIVLGLGTLSHRPSMFQLSLGLEIAKVLGVEIVASDPMFTGKDNAFLSSLGIKVEKLDITSIGTDAKTLIYAPHVPKSVYEVILRTFWHDLSNLVILGNNLRHYKDMYDRI